MKTRYTLLLLLQLLIVSFANADNFRYYRKGKLVDMPKQDWSRVFVTTRQQPTAGLANRLQRLVPGKMQGGTRPQLFGPCNGFVLSLSGASILSEVNYRKELSALLADPQVVSVLPAFLVKGYDANDPLYVSGKILIEVPTSDVALWQSKLEMNQLSLAEELPMGPKTMLVAQMQPKADVFSIARKVFESGGASIVEPNMVFTGKNHYIPNDPLFATQWFLDQASDRDIDAPEAWDEILAGAHSSVTVAVIDGNGYQMDHPDLSANFTRSFDAVNNDSVPSPENAFSNHGTPCAGLVGGITNNALGCASVGAQFLKVAPCVLGFGATSTGNFSTDATIVARTASWLTGVARVVASSHSYGFGSGSFATSVEASYTVMRNTPRGGLGAVLLASTGNSGLLNPTQFPASYSTAIGVGASDASDLRAGFSNFGTLTDVAAPGVATPAADRTGADGYSTTDYTNFNGTSAACPVAAGVVGLMGTVQATATVAALEYYLQTSADKVGGYAYTNVVGRTLGTWSAEFGYGRVNANRAVTAAKNLVALPITTAPETITPLVCGVDLASTTVGFKNDLASYITSPTTYAGLDRTFSFTVPNTATYTISLTGSSINHNLFLFTDLTSLGNSTFGAASITSTLAAGTYYVNVDAPAGEGAFSIRLDCGPCIPTGRCNSGDYFSRITFNGIATDSVTSCSVPYSSFSAPAFTYQFGQTAPYRLSHGPSFSQHNQIYIDLNRDGDFTDAGETILNSTSTALRRTGSIFISEASPYNVGAPFTTIIRFRCSFTTQGPGSCATVSFGETRDYRITLLPPLVVPRFTLVSPTSTLCSGVQQTLAFTVNPSASVADTATLELVDTATSQVLARLTLANPTYTLPTNFGGTVLGVSLRAKNFATTSNRILLSINPNPLVLSVTDGRRCGPGQVTIQAFGSPSAGIGFEGQYLFFDTPTSPSPVFSSSTSSVLTPFISTSATYFVAYQCGPSGAATCTSLTRTPVQAIIDSLPATPIASLTQPSCSVSTGTITVAPQISVQYSLDSDDDYQPSNVFDGLEPQTYTVYVRKLNGGCVSSATGLVITPPPINPLTPDVIVTEPSCTTPAGRITITPQENVQYSIDGFNYQSSNVFNGLSGGIYTVYVMSLTGECVSSVSGVVVSTPPTIPAPPVVGLIQPTCTVGTGTLTVVAQSGVEYSLDGNTYQTNTVFSLLPPNTYNVFARGINGGCISSVSNLVINNAPLIPDTVLVSATSGFCGSSTLTATRGTNGTIYFQGTASGGTSLLNPTTSSIVTSTGIYFFRAQSSSGCWGVEDSVFVSVNRAPVVTTSTPTSGPVGSVVTLTGTNFTGVTSVLFNGIQAPATVLSTTQIQAIVPTNGLSGVIAVGRTTCPAFTTTRTFNIQAPGTSLDWRWVRRGATSATGAVAQFNRVRTHVTGDFVAAGYFSGANVVFDGSNNSSRTHSSVGGRDGIVARYGRQGILNWTARFAGAGDDEALGLAIDIFGSTYVTGYFNGTVTITSNSPSPTTLTSAGGSDMFVAKFNTQGLLTWAFRMGSTGNDRAEGIDIAPDNNFYVAGSFIGNTAIGGLFGTVVPLTSRGNFDAFLAKFSGLASLYWTIQGGGTGNDFGFGVAADRTGGGYLMGSFEGTALYNSNLGNLTPITKTSVGGSDGFVLGVSVTGNLDWVTSMGGATNENIRDVAPDPRGTGLVAVGGFSNVATFGPLGTLSSTGFSDAFAVRLSNSGAFEWVRRAGSFDRDQAMSVRLDRQGQALVAMNFGQNSPIFGAPTNSVSAGAIDGLIVKLDASGTPLWRAQIAGTGGDDAANGIDTAANGGAVAVGFMANNTRFGFLGMYSVVGTRDAWIGRYTTSAGAFREKNMLDGAMPFTSGIRIYPNPSSKVFSVDFEGTSGKIQVYSMDGRIALSHTVSVGERVAHALPKGAYSVRLTTDTGKQYTSRLVIE